MADEARFDASKNITTIGASRIVFHCHHYNVFLQRSIEEALGADGAAVQRAAAAEAAQRMLSGLFTDAASLRDRLARVQKLFGSLGFGAADASALSVDGGPVTLRTSHYAIGWRSKFGPNPRPVCHFATGFWAGALATVAGLPPERVRADEVRCAVTGQGTGGCEIRVEVL